MWFWSWFVCDWGSGTGRERAGGLAFFWADNSSVDIQSYSLNHIHGTCLDEETNSPWHICGIYGFPTEHLKWRTWQLIRTLSGNIDGRWICFGDFNHVIESKEKIGGNTRSDAQLGLGRGCLDSCNLIDMGFVGYPFTWSNGRQGNENIQCRLDRVCCNEEFINRFSPLKVTHLPRYGSDHAVILILLEAPVAEQRRKPRIFRFEEVWSKDEKCGNSMRRRWQNGVTNCVDKIDALKGLDVDFEEYRVGGLKKEILKVENELKESNRWDGTAEDIARYKELERYHEELLRNEETMWRQRSRAMWLKDGDRNTKFFHSKASQRRKVNEIKKIKDENGIWWRSEEQVERVFTSYFVELFASSMPSDIEETCLVVKDKLNPEMVDWCSTPFTSEEVFSAITKCIL